MMIPPPNIDVLDPRLIRSLMDDSINFSFVCLTFLHPPFDGHLCFAATGQQHPFDGHLLLRGNGATTPL
jgi:hypothetical protein